MKRDTIAKLEHFMRHVLETKLRNDLRKLRITKEADAECCIYYHLRRTIPADGYWTILGIRSTISTCWFFERSARD